jgi:undecaprenol kinase
MGSKDNEYRNKNEWIRFKNSFRFAFAGLKYALLHERNMQIHVVVTVVVMVLALLLSVPTLQMLVLLVVIGVVLALELVNTAMEHVVDLVTDDFYPLAKAAKDLSAAAVLVFSMIAAVIGIMIFLKPILYLL